MKIVLVLPCYNEEMILEKNIQEIVSTVKKYNNYDIKIVISDNNSSDKTSEIGKKIASNDAQVDYFFVEKKGKGAAIAEAWKKYDADIYGFIDADLAVDLQLIAPALLYFEKGYDGVVGSRGLKESTVERGVYRKIVSVFLNFFIRALFRTRIRDTACGFKFFNKKIISEILPNVKNRDWVFDTELLIVSEKLGFRIKEMAVKWKEMRECESSVIVVPTSMQYLKELIRIKKSLK